MGYKVEKRPVLGSCVKFPVVLAAAAIVAPVDGVYLCNATSAAFAVTLPLAAAAKGMRISIKKTDASANAVTVTRAGTDTIDGATTSALSAQWSTVEVISDGVTGWFKM